MVNLTNRSPGPGVLPVAMLVLIIGWALFAVLMLTGTVTAANQIDARVGVINAVYPRIDQNLKSVPLAEETAQISGRIRAAAAPLSDQFSQIVRDVGGIQASADSIRTSADQINGKVISIDTRVRSIDASVGSIGAGLAATDRSARSINDSVHSIGERFRRILDHSHPIDDRLVHGSNDRIQEVIDQAVGIKDDTDRLVSPLVPDILKNAHAIAGSPVIAPLDTSRLDLRRLNPVLAALRNPAQLSSLLGLTGAAKKPPLPVLQALPVQHVVPEVAAPEKLLAPLKKKAAVPLKEDKPLPLLGVLGSPR